MIVKSGGKLKVVSHTGRNLGGPYASTTLGRKQARKRLQQIEYFKHKRKG